MVVVAVVGVLLVAQRGLDDIPQILYRIRRGDGEHALLNRRLGEVERLSVRVLHRRLQIEGGSRDQGSWWQIPLHLPRERPTTGDSKFPTPCGSTHTQELRLKTSLNLEMRMPASQKALHVSVEFPGAISGPERRK
uniref:Uncharacterized protein n=1 Tax=Arundo donax TaxID=35708 RepID=A0A0A9FVR9_ARUDO